MDVEAHIEQLRVDGSRLAAVVALGGPDASVRACPGWAVRDLVHHLGRVHRWATAFVAGALTRPDQVEFATLGAPLPHDGELVDWYVAGHSALVEALATAPTDLQCWSFLAAPSPLAFWARRQAHETAVHRVDLEQAAGAAIDPVPPDFAADGLDELLTGFVPRVRARSQDEHVQRSGTLRVAPTDADARWLVTIGPEQPTTVSGNGAREARADCTVRGRAEDLYLVLWKRRDADTLVVDGDRDALASFLGLVRV
jgi:uncharacterized protein (TIGR03083 family)